MNQLAYLLQRAVLPACVLIVVCELHFGWHVLHASNVPPTVCCAEGSSADCCEPPANTSATDSYLREQLYWLGIAYALPLAFAAASLRQYREQRSSTHRTLAVGSLTFYGVLASAGCFLTGCCGSPMLAIYASFLGTAYLPVVRPLIAALSALSVLSAWWWINRRTANATACGCATSCCGDKSFISDKQAV